MARREHRRVVVDGAALRPVTRIDVAVPTGMLTCLHPTQELPASEPATGHQVIVHVEQIRRLPGTSL